MYHSKYVTVGPQDPCDLVSVINNTNDNYAINLDLYPTNDITFVYSSNNPDNKVVLFPIEETLNSSNLLVRVYRDNTGVWVCMC